MIDLNRGVYTVQFKWGLFLFENTKQHFSEYINRDSLLKMLRQKFVEDEIKIILYTLEDGEKLIMDLAQNKVRKVSRKPRPYEMEALGPYFNPKSLANIYEESEESL